MSAASDRRRSLDPQVVADKAIRHLNEWKVPAADVVWAIDRGGKGIDKRSKTLMAVMEYGASRLVPFDGQWAVRGNRAILDALPIVRAHFAAVDEPDQAADAHG